MQNLEQMRVILDNLSVIAQTGELLFKILQSLLSGNDLQGEFLAGNIPYQINFTKTAASTELQNGKSVKLFATFQHFYTSSSIARNSFIPEYA